MINLYKTCQVAYDNVKNLEAHTPLLQTLIPILERVLQTSWAKEADCLVELTGHYSPLTVRASSDYDALYGQMLVRTLLIKNEASNVLEIHKMVTEWEEWRKITQNSLDPVQAAERVGRTLMMHLHKTVQAQRLLLRPKARTPDAGRTHRPA